MEFVVNFLFIDLNDITLRATSMGVVKNGV